MCGLATQYFKRLKIPFYFPHLFRRFQESIAVARNQLVDNFRLYYTPFSWGEEPPHGLLDDQLVEEIHMASVGSTNLTVQIYRATIASVLCPEAS